MLNLANTAPGTDVRWNWRDMIHSLDLTGGGAAYYGYGVDKQRVRKVLVRNPDVLNGGTLREDRIYLGGFELYRRYTGDPDDPIEEIESHHLLEGEQRVLLVDDVIRTRNPRPGGLTVQSQTVFRYQYADQVGSVAIELSENAELISYEEFHPYGGCAYRKMNSAIQAPAKRYRFAGMERDEESQLAYHTSRYLIPWLGRWASADPSFLEGGQNLYAYASGNPAMRSDSSGLDDEPVRLDERTSYGRTSRSMEEAAAAIRDTWGWEDQEFAQQARNFYYKQFQDSFRQKANQQAKMAYTVWAFMLIAIASGVAAGVVGGGIAAGLGGEAAVSSGSLPLGAKVLGAIGGGLAGGGVDVGLEQVLRLVVDERLITEGEVAGRVALSGLLAGAGELLSSGIGALVNRLSNLGPLTNDARMAQAIAASNEGLKDVTQLTGKQRVLADNQIKGVLKEAASRDIAGLPIDVQNESSFLKMSSTTSSSRRADAPIYESLSLEGELKPTIMQVKDVSGKLSKRDLQQIVTSIRSADARGGMVDLYVNPDTQLSWNARTKEIKQLLRRIELAIDRGALNVLRFW
jgi:RHS repeat-associated protein